MVKTWLSLAAGKGLRFLLTIMKQSLTAHLHVRYD